MRNATSPTLPGPLTAKAGKHVVTFTTLGPTAHRIETTSGSVVGRVVDELTFTLANERLARTLGRVIVIALRQHGATVESAQQAAANHLNEMLLDLGGGQAAANRAGYLQKVKAMFESVEDREWAGRLVDDMRQHLGMDAAPARSFRDLRDRHAAAIQRDAADATSADIRPGTTVTVRYRDRILTGRVTSTAHQGTTLTSIGFHCDELGGNRIDDAVLIPAVDIVTAGRPGASDRRTSAPPRLADRPVQVGTATYGRQRTVRQRVAA